MIADIYIREKNGKKEIRIPVMPEHIVVEFGKGMFVTYDILGKGEVAEPTGVGLAGISWNSEFPGQFRTDTSMIRGKLQTPAYYHKIIESWRQNKTPLNILVIGYPINYDVYVSDYNADIRGAFGDIPYEIKFVQDKNITVSKTIVKNTASSTTKRATTKVTQYTIKSGDTLWGISTKFYGTGTKWELIYNANKTIIEQTAKKYGRTSSNRGNWIWPGVTITIPDANTTIKTSEDTSAKKTTPTKSSTGSYLSQR